MKAASLFHLMQLRLQGLEASLPGERRADLEEIQSSLKVGHGREFFEITWRFRNREFSLAVADRDFGFHIAGDSSLAVDRRGDAAGTRARNWAAAAALWRRVAEISGVDLPASAFSDALAPTPGARESQGGHAFAIVAAAAALAVGLFGWQRGGVVAGLEGVAMAGALSGLASLLEGTHLRRRASPAEALLVAAGVALALLLPPDGLTLAPLMVGIAAAAALERIRRWSPLLWAVAGAVAGGATFYGAAAAAGALALGAALALAALAAPMKLHRGSGLAFAAAAAMAIAAALALPADWLASRSGPYHADGWPVVAAWTIAFVLVLAFGLWWIQGSLFDLVPWLGMGALAVAALAAVGVTGASTSIIALGGFALLLVGRLVGGMQGAGKRA